MSCSSPFCDKTKSFWSLGLSVWLEGKRVQRKGWHGSVFRDPSQPGLRLSQGQSWLPAYPLLIFPRLAPQTLESQSQKETETSLSIWLCPAPRPWLQAPHPFPLPSPPHFSLSPSSPSSSLASFPPPPYSAGCQSSSRYGCRHIRCYTSSPHSHLLVLPARGVVTNRWSPEAQPSACLGSFPKLISESDVRIRLRRGLRGVVLCAVKRDTCRALTPVMELLQEIYHLHLALWPI